MHKKANGAPAGAPFLSFCGRQTVVNGQPPQYPTLLPSFLVITTVAERGRLPAP